MPTFRLFIEFALLWTAVAGGVTVPYLPFDMSNTRRCTESLSAYACYAFIIAKNAKNVKPFCEYFSICPLRATNFTCYNGLIRYITYAGIITLLTTPAQRNIRAYYRGEKCNAFLRQICALIKVFFLRFAGIPQIKN